MVIPAHVEITKSVQKLELNVDIQQATKPDLLPKMPNIKYFGSYLSPTAVKAGISQTFETIGKVQSQIVDTAKIGIDRFKSTDSALGSVEMVNKVEFDALQAQLNAEISEKIKTKLSRDRIKRAYGEEIARLESILKFHNIEFDSILNTLMNQE